MQRVVVTLLFASGCDLVFTVEPFEPIAACGPYEQVEVLAFPDLEKVTDFSIDATGTTGFVMATRNGDPRLTPVMNAGGSDWVFDRARLLDLDELHDNSGVRAGRTSPNGDLYLVVNDLADNQPRVFQYRIANTLWGVVGNLPLSPESDTEVTVAGGAIEINDGISADRFTRHVPILHQLLGSGDRFVAIATSEPNFPTRWHELVAKDGKRVTEAINARHQVTQASIGRVPTGERQLVMAYAADSQLFLSSKDDEIYERAARLTELDEPGEEVEPFLSTDCQTLYFRRITDDGSQIIKAQVKAL